MGNEVTERQQAGVASTEDPVDGEDGLAVADLGVLELAVVRVDDTSRDGVEASACGGVVASELAGDGCDQHCCSTHEDECKLLHRSLLEGIKAARGLALQRPATPHTRMLRDWEITSVGRCGADRGERVQTGACPPLRAGAPPRPPKRQDRARADSPRGGFPRLRLPAASRPPPLLCDLAITRHPTGRLGGMLEGEATCGLDPSRPDAPRCTKELWPHREEAVMSVLHDSDKSRVRATSADPEATHGARQQRAGGVAALYLAVAYLVAMPYFLIVVDYPSLTDPAQKVAALVEHQSSMYAMHLLTLVIFGIVLAGLTLALWKRLAGSPTIAAAGCAVGLIWAAMLVASGLVFNFGAGTVVDLHATSPTQATAAWQAIEPVADGLGSGGGELLGGLWVLLVSVAALRTATLPRALNWLGILIGVAGIASVIPVLLDARYLFGLLQILWFIWLGVAMLRTPAIENPERQLTSAR